MMPGLLVEFMIERAAHTRTQDLLLITASPPTFVWAYAQVKFIDTNAKPSDLAAHLEELCAWYAYCGAPNSTTSSPAQPLLPLAGPSSIAGKEER
jgi:hypothetical protein